MRCAYWFLPPSPKRNAVRDSGAEMNALALSPPAAPWRAPQLCATNHCSCTIRLGSHRSWASLDCANCAVRNCATLELSDLAFLKLAKNSFLKWPFYLSCDMKFCGRKGPPFGRFFTEGMPDEQTAAETTSKTAKEYLRVTIEKAVSPKGPSGRRQS